MEEGKGEKSVLQSLCGGGKSASFPRSSLRKVMRENDAGKILRVVGTMDTRKVGNRIEGRTAKNGQDLTDSGGWGRAIRAKQPGARKPFGFTMEAAFDSLV